MCASKSNLIVLKRFKKCRDTLFKKILQRANLFEQSELFARQYFHTKGSVKHFFMSVKH